MITATFGASSLETVHGERAPLRAASSVRGCVDESEEACRDWFMAERWRCSGHGRRRIARTEEPARASRLVREGSKYNSVFSIYCLLNHTYIRPFFTY